jgi:hypothetical protein
LQNGGPAGDEPARPDLVKRSAGPAPGSGVEYGDIGSFRPGSQLSQWALARYLVGRCIATSVANALSILALVLFGLAALCEWGAHSLFLAILFVLAALVVLALRAVLRAVLERLTAAAHYAPLEERLHALVADTRRDVRAELRRIGLPGRPWSLPFLALRLIRRRRRAETLERLRAFQLDRAVTPARVDELHHILRAATSAPRP